MSKIYVDEILPKDNAKITAADLQLPAGSVVQTVHADFVEQSTILSQGGDDIATHITVNITPKFASSKFVITTVTGTSVGGTKTNFRYLRLFRNGTEVDSTRYHKVRTSFNDITDVVPCTYIVTDTPNTTNTLTYTIYGNDGNGGGMGIGGRVTGGAYTISTIIVQEIAQ